ncbi:MAG TPA: M12 family metallo-peptidase, partial [Saprospiraceae bacterium]|nr:M12 family metallo-peptidase [Saprospiraceae bacterium]
MLILALITFVSLHINAQGKDPFGIEALENSIHAVQKPLFGKTHLTARDKRTTHFTLFEVNKKTKRSIQSNAYALIASDIPTGEKDKAGFLFTPYDFFAPEFQVLVYNRAQVSEVAIDRGLHLKGMMPGQDASFASLSLFEDEIYGSVYAGPDQQASILPYPYYSTSVAKCMVINENQSSTTQTPPSCSTDDIAHYFGDDSDIHYRLSDNCKMVLITVHADYDLYLRFGGNIQLVSNYVIGLFNNVHTLYKREGISIALAQLVVHGSEDGFTHLSASEDLEKFRRTYPNTNKTVKLLLSGKLKNNQAALGGIAYINTLCLSSYSYAYANVYGSYLDAPVYSWDVLMVTHELGHVMGSRHTHACVWGPLKNKAIDNCAKLEGSCASPGLPVKGTIMSYCYQSGMPGIDLGLGFGLEPGSLIRAKVKASSCLTSYVPSNKTLDQPETGIEANLECTDGAITHYYYDNNTIAPDDDILLLSIKKNGNQIGQIGDGSFIIKQNTTTSYGTGSANQITAAYTDSRTPWYVAGKYWEIHPTRQPATPVQVICYTHQHDMDDLIGSTGGRPEQDLKLIQLSSPANPDPESNHLDATIERVRIYDIAPLSDTNHFSMVPIDSQQFRLELSSTRLQHMGIGMYATAKTSIQTEFGDLSAGLS